MADEKIKVVLVYLPEGKRKTVKEIATAKRLSMTKLIEGEIDKMIKREEKQQ